MAEGQEQIVSENLNVNPYGSMPKQDGGCVVFCEEKSLFGSRKPNFKEFVKHEEMYTAVAKSVNGSHITGLQRINGMWRIYLDNVADKVTLISKGVTIRDRTLPILPTNPLRLDSEITTRIRVQNIPLSVDDGIISRTLILKELDVISVTREKLRIGGKLTNCETGDRIVLVKTSTLREPLHRFMAFGQFKAKVIHRGQVKPVLKCTKCLEDGHYAKTCPNDWKCRQCNKVGHKQADCPLDDITSSESEEDTPHETSDDDTSSAKNKQQTKTNKTADKSPTTKHSKGGRKSRAAQKQNKTGQQLMDKFIQCDKDNLDTPNKQNSATKYVHSPPTPADTDVKKQRNDT